MLELVLITVGFGAGWWVSSCDAPPVVTEYEEVRVHPAPELVAPCPRSRVAVESFGDLLPAATLLEHERDVCAERMDDLRRNLLEPDHHE